MPRARAGGQGNEPATSQWLQRSHVIGETLEAFQQATGLTLRFVPVASSGAAAAAKRATSEAQLQAGAHLLGILAQHFAARAGTEPLDGRQTEPLAVVRAKTFALVHLLEPVKTRDAARAAHLSLPHFCRLFKRVTGMTFTSFLTRCRVQKARQLLADFSLRITDVAFAAGFQSIPHFDHSFKRYTGQSPREYRQGL